MSRRKKDEGRKNQGGNRRQAPSHSSGSGKTYTGLVDVTRSGMAFVAIEGHEQDVRVHPSNLGSALDGDEVTVRIIRKPGSNGREEGEVVKVLKRRHTSFAGTVQMSEGFAFLVTQDAALPDIYVSLDNLHGAKDGDRAVIRITDWGGGKHNPSGEVTLVMDKTDKNDTAMKEILVESGFPLSFSREVMDAAEALADTIDAAEIAKRRDLRNTFTITIDPVDAKDFDDAISLRRLENGHYEVGVHIADVSHYVLPGTALDEEAYRRATSVYLADRVLPMLPERISNQLCSLRPHEDKLTFSVIFEMTEHAEVVSSWIGRTVIHSNHRFTYEEVQDIIEAEGGLYGADILLLNKMAQVLRKKRIAGGAINFTTTEVRFKLDENAIPIGVELKESKETHQLVEEMMLLANRTVAEYAAGIKINNNVLLFPYRVHDVPDQEKLKLFVAFAAKFGYRFDVSSPEGIARSFNEMLQRVQGEPEELVLGQLGIRTMSKAVYTTDNIGHYGLGFAFYCHFTSPIRRYPDVMVHRIIAECLAGNPQEDRHLETKCRHCSDMERKAMEAERAANKYKQVEYMLNHIGDEFDAVVSGVARFGFWAETLEAKCEGMVSIESLLPVDVFTYMEHDYALVGTASHLKFRMGDSVRVRLVAANLDKRQLDYELVIEHKKPEAAAQAKRKKMKK
jgi:ribonuclease R